MAQVAVTDKSKKSDILDAYHELLKETIELKKSSRKEQKKEVRTAETVERAIKHHPDNFLKELTELKLSTGKLLDNIADQIAEEYKKLTEVREAIIIETEKLKEQYEINATADTLDALLLAQSRKKSEFEQEMEQKQQAIDKAMVEKREQWNKEKEQVELQQKEEQQLWKKAKQREEDEYNYQQQLKHQKELDEFEQKKAALERELAEKTGAVEKALHDREAALSERELELNELHTKVTAFPDMLNATVEEAEKSLKARLDREFRFEADLQKKEIEGEIKLSQQKIINLEAKIKEQVSQIQQLTDRSSQATSQVQEIAIKALEGPSASRLYDQSNQLKVQKVEA